MYLLIKENKKLKINTLAIIICILSSQSIFAQILDHEQNPPSVKWRHIQTGHFQVIYPAEFEKQAQDLTNTLEMMIEKEVRTLGKKPRKISIILQTRNMDANGFVQLAPRKSEFMTTPPQHTDFQEWTNSLAVHELRHVVQFDKLTGYLGPPVFEQLALAIFGITLPTWFYEGDAVGMETSLSIAGRGRTPSWWLTFRTNTLSNIRNTYQKDYLGSFKSLTPGYYQLGYFMTTKMRRDYGPGILDSLMTRMAKNPIRPYNFSQSLAKFTGYTTQAWHKKTIQELDSLWRMQLRQIRPQNYAYFPKTDITMLTDFLLPQALPNGTIIALQRSNRSVPKLVKIAPSGSITEIIKTGIQTNPHFAYGGGKITWDEYRYDKRYHKQSFQVINVLDLQTGRYRQLTHKTRLFSPTIGRSGKHIAAIEIDLKNQAYLILMNSKTGTVIQRFSLPENLNVQTPSFNLEENTVITSVVGQQGANLMEIDLNTGHTHLLLDWQQQQLERPIYADKIVIFKAHYNDIDNLYALENGHIRQLTNIAYGAYNPSYDAQNRALYFNNYQQNGYFISTIPLTEMPIQNQEKTSNSPISYFKPLLKQENISDTLPIISNKIFASAPYNELKNLFNFHSLSPVGDDISSIDNFDLGLQWLSDNLLSTFSTRLGFNYNQNISRMEYFATLNYDRWYPKLSLTYRNQAQLSSIRLQNQPNAVLPFRWREHYTEFRVSFPFLFNRLNTIYNTALSLGTAFTSRYGYNIPNLNIPDFGTLRFPLFVQYYFDRNARQSPLDLAPKWGQNINFLFRSLTFDQRLGGNLFALRSTFYFPGLVNNHSFQVRFNAQQRSDAYRFSNEIPLVSGYDELNPSDVHNTLLLNYRFPIAYPDWSIGTLAFVKRLRGGLFSDFENFARNEHYAPRTFGMELRADLNLLRFYLPNFDAGVKAIYVNENGPKKMVFTYGVTYNY